MSARVSEEVSERACTWGTDQVHIVSAELREARAVPSERTEQRIDFDGRSAVQREGGEGGERGEERGEGEGGEEWGEA